MKKTTLVIALPFMALLFVGCDSGSSKKSTSSNSNNSYSDYCTQYPTSTFCSSSNTGSTTSGLTTGTTTGSTTGSYTTIPSDNNWAALYPSGAPTGSCSSATGSGYETRKGTITVAGGTMYSPANAWGSVGDSQYSSARYTHNNSYFLVNVSDAKTFLDTDSVLRVRFKPRPQPQSPVGKTWCYNRALGQASDSYGYTNLRYTVALREVNSDGTLGNYLKAETQTVGVNSCGSAINFDGFNSSRPNGVALVVYDVYSDTGCSYQKGCTAYKAVRAASCWSMDLEVQVDGTKSIN